MAIATLAPAAFTPLKSRFSTIKTGLKKATIDLGKSSKLLFRKTRVKAESIRLRKSFFAKREEGIRRKEKEGQLEAAKIGAGRRRGGNPLGDLGKGLLEKIMDTLGTFLVGWLVYNLPTIMTMAENLIGRIKIAGSVITGFFGNVIKIFTGTAKIAGAIFQNVVTLDIFDTNKRVRTAFSELTNTFDDLHTNIKTGIDLVTKPLGELPGEKEVPRTGTDYTTPPGTGGGYATAGLSGESQRRIGNDAAFLAEVKRVSQKYGIKEGDLLGLMASESGLNPASGQIGGHVGLIQFGVGEARSVGTSQAALKRMSRAEQMKYVDKYFETRGLKRGAGAGQLYATVFAPAYANANPNTVLYSSPSAEYRSNSPLDANRDGKITIAEMGGRIEKKKKEFGISDNISIASISSATPTEAQPIGQSAGWQVENPRGAKVKGYSGLTPHHSYQTASGGREVRDFTIFKDGKYMNVPVPSPISGKVNWAGWAGNGGLWVEIASSAGLIELGHFSKLLVKAGQQISAGTILGLQGKTGSATGYHVHIQAKSNVIRDYVNSLASGTSPTGGMVEMPSLAPEDISSQPGQIRAESLPPVEPISSEIGRAHV